MFKNFPFTIVVSKKRKKVSIFSENIIAYLTFYYVHKFRFMNLCRLTKKTAVKDSL